MSQPEKSPMDQMFDDILCDIAIQGAIEASRDENGKPDPYKTAGMVFGMGYTSAEDYAQMAAMLGAQGAFDSDKTPTETDYEYDFDDDDSDSDTVRKIAPVTAGTGKKYEPKISDYDPETGRNTVTGRFMTEDEYRKFRSETADRAFHGVTGMIMLGLVFLLSTSGASVLFAYLFHDSTFKIISVVEAVLLLCFILYQIAGICIKKDEKLQRLDQIYENARESRENDL